MAAEYDNLRPPNLSASWSKPGYRRPGWPATALAGCPVPACPLTRFWFKTPKRYRWLYYISRLHATVTREPLPFLWTRIESSVYCFSVNKRIADYTRALESTRN